MGSRLGLATVTGAVDRRRRAPRCRREQPRRSRSAARRRLQRRRGHDSIASELQRMPGTGGDIVTHADRDARRGEPPDPARLLRRRDPRLVAAGLQGAGRRLRDPGPVPQHRVSRDPARRVDRRRSTYIPGGFDVAYGRASSGIVQLTTRPGGDDAQRAGRGLADRRRADRAGPGRQEDPVHVRPPPLDDRPRAAVGDPGQRRPVAHHRAELLRRAVPDRPRAEREVEASRSRAWARSTRSSCSRPRTPTRARSGSSTGPRSSA